MAKNGGAAKKEPAYGPGNPHPLSTLKTELVWEGKYDEFGNRRTVEVAACAMPMQRIETIDEPKRQAIADGRLALFEKENRLNKSDDFRNRLIWGDNKLIMASLLKEFKGKIDLIYIDPPFDVGADFTMDVPIGDGKDDIEKEQSTLEMVAYRDIWGKGTDSYLHMMHERLLAARELLTDTGCFYLHCDWRMSPYLRSVLDEVFGRENFQNEIYWYYYNKLHGATKQVFPRATDTILYYVKNREAKYKFHHIAEPREKPITKLKYSFIKGKIVNDKDENGKAITYVSTERQIDNVWRIRMLQPADKTEFLGYSTQKPEDIIERMLLASTDEGDLVADFFCGSGTTGAVAERLNRRWIMADLGRFAIHTSRKRLIELQRKLHEEGKPYRAFDVYNLGRYERQWWQKERLHGAEEEHRRVVLEFFKAEVLEGAPSPLIHGRKAGAFCHVDGIDSIFDRQEARAVAQAAAGAGGRECYILAWEFEMDLRLTTAALEKELGVRLMLIQIPREIMEKNRKSPPPFLEMAVLEAQPVYQGKGKDRTADIKITRFMPTLAEVPGKELEALKERAIRSGTDFIDFWAVDFDWQPGKPFNHHWQDYRTRKDRSLKTVSDAAFKYDKAGTYTACVKVVDTFGCDTSISVEIRS